MLAMHAAGGHRWRSWSEKLRRILDEHQRADLPELAGSWDPDGRSYYDENRLEVTALNALALEAPYRFPLPVAP